MESLLNTATGHQEPVHRPRRGRLRQMRPSNANLKHQGSNNNSKNNKNNNKYPIQI